MDSLCGVSAFCGWSWLLFRSDGLWIVRRLWRSQDAIEVGPLVSVVLLLVGGVIGGYVGDSYMDLELVEAFVKARIASRFDSDPSESLGV